MEKQNRKYFISLGIMAVIALIVLILGMKIHRRDTDKVVEVAVNSPKPTVVVKESVKEVEVKREITTEVIAEELREMGELNTAEYCFTIVEQYSKIKPVFKVFDSTASFMYSYDGSISAGIDCDGIEIDKDDENKVITITLPKSKITHIDIDKDSFQSYSEKEQLWNKLTIEDYNDSLKEFETRAKARATEKGIINKADENAAKTIGSFVTSLVDDNEYEINVVTRGVE